MSWACRNPITSRPSRRAVLAGLAAAALPAAPGAAGADPVEALRGAARAMPRLQSLIVLHDGAPLLAEAFRGPAPDRPVNVKSLSKAIVAALTGIAIGRGELSGTDQKVAPFLGRWLPRRADPRVREITVGDLLSMRAGLEPVSGDGYGDWVHGRNWIYDALSRPMLADPGTRMLYSTANTHMLGTILAEVGGADLRTLARERLGDPLGFSVPDWPTDPQGRYLGGNDMRLSPRALAVFGECCRNDGRHGAVQVIPAGWTADCWQPRGRSEETGHRYGYGWYDWTAGGRRVAYVRGYGGQMLFVAPGAGLVAVITSDPGEPARPEGYLGALFGLFEARILPMGTLPAPGPDAARPASAR